MYGIWPQVDRCCLRARQFDFLTFLSVYMCKYSKCLKENQRAIESENPEKNIERPKLKEHTKYSCECFFCYDSSMEQKYKKKYT